MSPCIFVGTLACGEAEFDECRVAIAAQTGVAVTHRIIEGLPELEAHNALWEAWAKMRPSHDLFVKVDADTVLMRTTALAEIAALFEDPEVTGAQILLHDYFTDRLIAGLNSFSGQVAFKMGTNRLFADRVDSGHNKVLKGEVLQHLAPIGWHCRNPHPQQAFHFGLHRAYKKQTEVVARTAAVWLEKRDTSREWALAGAMSAGWQLRRHFDYRDPCFEAAFQALKGDSRRTAKIEAFARRVAQGA